MKYRNNDRKIREDVCDDILYNNRKNAAIKSQVWGSLTQTIVTPDSL